MNPENNNETLVRLAESIKTWWEDHRTDTCGDYGEYNVYSDEPVFVTIAKEVLGDWESMSVREKFPAEQNNISKTKINL